MKITLAFLLLGLTAIFAQQPDADASSVEAFIDVDEDVQQGHRMLPNYKPPKQPKCDPSPKCWGNNCCGGQCYEVCEEIGGWGGKKGGKKGGFYYGGGYYGGWGGKKGGYYGFDEVICETVCEGGGQWNGGYDYEYGYIGGGGGQWNGNWNQPCQGYGCNGHGQQWNNKPSYPQNDGCYEICEEDCFRGGKGGKKGGFGPGYYNYYDDGPDDWGPDDDWGYGYYGGGFGGKGGKKGGFGGCTERCEIVCPPKPKCDPSPYCKGYNCCYEPCEIVCEFIEFRGGKKGGFGGKKGGFYYGGYYSGYYGGKGGKKGGYYGGKGGKKGGYYSGGEEICEEVCGYGPIYPGPIAPPKKGGNWGNNKYPNYAPPKGGNYW